MEVLALLLVAVTIASTITLTPLLVQGAVSVAIPILTGIATKSGASAGVKQAATVVLSGASALIVASTTTTGVAVISVETALLAGMGWIIAIASYNGLYRPHDIDDRLAPEFGIGTVVETRSFEKG